ncbi:MAG: hypothetical protein M3415_04020 [Actinomycetota bacterium]|nr:hypothetical protein [Actinomycetota bacterium]
MFADEAVGAVLVGAGQDGGAGGADLGGAAVVHVGRSEQADAAVDGVVVREELATEGAGVLDAAEPLGELRD